MVDRPTSMLYPGMGLHLSGLGSLGGQKIFDRYESMNLSLSPKNVTRICIYAYMIQLYMHSTNEIDLVI